VLLKHLRVTYTWSTKLCSDPVNVAGGMAKIKVAYEHTPPDGDSSSSV